MIFGLVFDPINQNCSKSKRYKFKERKDGSMAFLLLLYLAVVIETFSFFNDFFVVFF